MLKSPIGKPGVLFFTIVLGVTGTVAPPAFAQGPYSGFLFAVSDEPVVRTSPPQNRPPLLFPPLFNPRTIYDREEFTLFVERPGVGEPFLDGEWKHWGQTGAVLGFLGFGYVKMAIIGPCGPCDTGRFFRTNLPVALFGAAAGWLIGYTIKTDNRSE